MITRYKVRNNGFMDPPVEEEHERGDWIRHEDYQEIRSALMLSITRYITGIEASINSKEDYHGGVLKNYLSDNFRELSEAVNRILNDEPNVKEEEQKAQ